MENAYKIFSNPEFGDLRVINIKGTPWFVAKEVCNVLSIINHRDAISSLDEDEKGVVTIYPLSKTKRGGGLQKTNIINESGLYSLIFQSRKPFAKAFRKWVTSEVLPTIRRTGCYKVAYPFQKKIVHLENMRKIDEERLEILQSWVLNIQKERDELLQQQEGRTDIFCTRDFSESMMTQLGKLIKSLSSDRKMTPSLLARSLAVDRVKILGFEQGKEDISLTVFLKMLSLMDYSFQFIKNESLIDD